MDVLRPPLININGRIYRKNPIQEEDYEEEEEEDYSYSQTGLCFWGPVNFITICVDTSNIVALFISPAVEQCLDEPCDTHNIEQTEKGFRCAIDVPSVLYKFVSILNWIFSFESDLIDLELNNRDDDLKWM